MRWFFGTLIALLICLGLYVGSAITADAVKRGLNGGLEEKPADPGGGGFEVWNGDQGCPSAW